MKTTRVAIVVPDGLSGRGGIGRVMTYLTRYLSAHVPDIRPRTYRTRLGMAPVLKHATVPLALAGFAIACALRRIDVIHLNVAPRGSTWRKALFARVGRMTGRPVILHLHGSGYDEFYAGLPPRRQAALRRFFRDVDRVVALSGYWHDFVTGTLGVPAERVVEIANGVPSADPPAVKTPGHPPMIAFLGVVGPRKGIDVLLRALVDPRLAAMPWRLTVGGNGEVAQAEELTRTLGIADRVTFLGWVGEGEVDRVLRDADLFVLPSRAENQPVSILEAMARATPVVASAIGAIPDQVADGVTGLLVPSDDVGALADAIAGLLSDPDRRLGMGEAGLARFAGNFSDAACAGRFADLYRSLRP